MVKVVVIALLVSCGSNRPTATEVKPMREVEATCTPQRLADALREVRRRSVEEDSLLKVGCRLRPETRVEISMFCGPRRGDPIADEAHVLRWEDGDCHFEAMGDVDLSDYQRAVVALGRWR